MPACRLSPRSGQRRPSEGCWLRCCRLPGGQGSVPCLGQGELHLGAAGWDCTHRLRTMKLTCTGEPEASLVGCGTVAAALPRAHCVGPSAAGGTGRALHLPWSTDEFGWDPATLSATRAAGDGQPAAGGGGLTRRGCRASGCLSIDDGHSGPTQRGCRASERLSLSLGHRARGGPQLSPSGSATGWDSGAASAATSRHRGSDA